MINTPHSKVYGLALIGSILFFWGLNWPAMKLALTEMPPLTFRVFCLAFGAIFLLGIGELSGAKLTFPIAYLPRVMLAAGLNITGWHVATGYGIPMIEAGRAVIAAYSMPLWTSLFGIWILNERPSTRTWIGLGLGMVAMGLLLMPSIDAVARAPVGVALVTLGAISWGMGTVVAKRWVWPMPTTVFVGWQMLIGLIPVAIAAVIVDPPIVWQNLSSWGLGGFAYAVIIPMGYCHWGYFKLLTLLPAHVTAISMLATPVVGVASAALILGEHFGSTELGALALVIGSLFLIHRPKHG